MGKKPNPTVGIRRKRDEVPLGFGGKEEFRKLMTVVPSWAHGLPIAAEAWSGPRFCNS